MYSFAYMQTDFQPIRHSLVKKPILLYLPLRSLLPDSSLLCIHKSDLHTHRSRASSKQTTIQYHHRGDQYLVHHLCVLATATSTHVFDVRSHTLEQRHHFLKRVLVSTNHDRQLAVTSANISSRHYRLHTGLLDYQEHPE